MVCKVQVHQLYMYKYIPHRLRVQILLFKGCIFSLTAIEKEMMQTLATFSNVKTSSCLRKLLYS